MARVIRTSVLLLLLVTGCSSNNGITPGSGSSTFSCQVDGTDWSPTLGTSGQQEISATYSNGYLQITAYHRPSVSDRSTIEIDLAGISSPGQFDLGFTQSHGYFVNELLSSYDQLYSTSLTYTGVVNVTRFDTLYRQATGTFSFEASNASGGLVTIRSGSFDLVF